MSTLTLPPITPAPDGRGLAAHAHAVAALARRVCERLALDEDQTRIVEHAALLHDIGKVAVPRVILDKASPLTDEEWEIVRRHPVLGETVARALGAPPEVWRLVRHHHERWDGAGYPDGLAGQGIPLGARIIAACDTFDAITSPRAYRDARSPWFALAEMTAVAGGQLDADVVAALVLEVGHA
jgi:two-component system, cell cycle response regulator